MENRINYAPKSKNLNPSELMEKEYDGEKQKRTNCQTTRYKDKSIVNDDKNAKMSNKKGEDECIGFSTLPDQLHKRAVKRGFDFSFMVVGQTGLGKTTFLRSLFPKANWENSDDGKATKTLQIEKTYMEVEEKGVRLRLNLIDTPGFGNSIDSYNDISLVDSYVKEQLEEYLKVEMGTRRQAMQDHRIHCCLYFLDPSSKRLKALDLQAIRILEDKVNVIPIISKADTFTASELNEVKNMIRKEVENHRLEVYQLPDVDHDDDDDDDYIAKDKELKRAYPFSIVCGNKVVEVGGKKIIGRIYPWGIVEVENKQHSDFKLLRYFLLNSHMHDLIETTKEVHYENYRSANLKKIHRTSAMQESEEQIDALLKEKEMKILEMQKKLEEMKSQISLNNITNKSGESNNGNNENKNININATLSFPNNIKSNTLNFTNKANIIDGIPKKGATLSQINYDKKSNINNITNNNYKNYTSNSYQNRNNTNNEISETNNKNINEPQDINAYQEIATIQESKQRFNIWNHKNNNNPTNNTVNMMKIKR